MEVANNSIHTPALPLGFELHEYSVLSVLGVGGFGITYLAMDGNLGLQVAIKEYFPSAIAARNHDSQAVVAIAEKHVKDFTWGSERFIQEAQTLAKFNQKTIVRVHRFFKANNTSYMVMALEEGQSLEAILKSAPSWSEGDVVNFIRPLMDALAVIHSAGILHRDIKPSNILIRNSDGSPVLLDFGSARSTISSQPLTAIVSPGYGPLEQYGSTDLQGPWTDIYSLAAVLYIMVTGRSPVPATERAIKDTLIPSVFIAMNQYHAHMLKAIDCALTMDCAKRPQTIVEWRNMMFPEGNSGVICNEAESASSNSAEMAPVALSATPVETQSQPPTLRTRRIRIFVGMILVALIMATAWLVPTKDMGHLFRSPIAYISLRLTYSNYIDAIKQLDFSKAYASLSPKTRSEIPIDDFKSAWMSEGKALKLTETVHSIEFSSSTEATVLSTSMSPTGSAINPQRWVAIDGQWYRDRSLEIQQEILEDVQEAASKLMATGHVRNFSILDVKTSWENVQSPVTTLRIRNDDAQPLEALFIEVRYVNTETQKVIAYSRKPLILPENPLLTGEASQLFRVAQSNNNLIPTMAEEVQSFVAEVYRHSPPSISENEIKQIRTELWVLGAGRRWAQKTPTTTIEEAGLIRQ